MKLLLLIAVILLITIASGKVIEKKKIARTVADEERSLEVEYLGSCREWRDSVKNSVKVNNHYPCLPILTNVASNPDFDDLNAHVFCTNVDESRSIVHFVEIYSGTDETKLSDKFVVSFIPSAPFRVLTKGITLLRRPNCFTTQDYCNGTNYVVNSCSFNNVEERDDERLDGDRHDDKHDDKHDDRRPEGDRHDDRRPGDENRPEGDRFDGDRNWDEKKKTTTRRRKRFWR